MTKNIISYIPFSILLLFAFGCATKNGNSKTFFGGKIIKAKNLMHGKISKIIHNKKGLFKNIQSNFDATRYHSLVIDRKTFPENLLITAESKNKTVMGLMHKNYNVHGFQFHPESISTKVGIKLIKNFIAY